MSSSTKSEKMVQKKHMVESDKEQQIELNVQGMT
jgi:hypothetical protein